MAVTEQPDAEAAERHSKITLYPQFPPKLVHSGTYALYETPDGGRHLVYRRLASVDETGAVRDIDGAEDAHLPDIPPQALPLIEAWCVNGFPPAVLAMLSGKLSPLSVMKALRNGAGDDAG